MLRISKFKIVVAIVALFPFRSNFISYLFYLFVYQLFNNNNFI